MEIGIVAQETPTNVALAAAWRSLRLDAVVLSPAEALDELGAGDVALLRLDVLATVDGFELGLGLVPDLRRAGVRILNPPAALLAAHDKLWTEERLAAVGLARPLTSHVLTPHDAVDVEPPFVVKPRYGSWGRDVHLCETERDLRVCLLELESRSWFRRHGALVQHLASRTRRDLRILVAGGRVVGAASRIAAPGEWRTNVSLGGARVPLAPSREAGRVAVAATAAVGGDLMGVDLLPVGGGHLVLEVNGAADFDDTYSLAGGSVYEDAAAALGLLADETAVAA
jgi:ribosomal protein S6--L-glutamate ligase